MSLAADSPAVIVTIGGEEVLQSGVVAQAIEMQALDDFPLSFKGDRLEGTVFTDDDEFQGSSAAIGRQVNTRQCASGCDQPRVR